MPQAVADFLASRQHEIFFVRDVSPGAVDPQVVAIADSLEAIVVTCNTRHFRPLISRAAHGKQRFRKAGCIAFDCGQSQARRRLEEVIDVVEYHAVHFANQSDKRLVMLIRSQNIAVQW